MTISRFIKFLGISILAIVITLILYSQGIGFFIAIDLKLKDVRFKLRQDIKPDNNVVIAAIDTKSIDELGRWPWDRKVIAELVQNLKYYGAKTIAFDIVFGEPSNIESDNALSSAVSQAGNVVGGYFFRNDEKVNNEESLRLLQKSKVTILKVAEDVKEVPVISFPYVDNNIAEISDASVISGYFNIIPDEDGIIRSLNMILLNNGAFFPSISIASLKNYLDTEVILNVAVYGVDYLSVGQKTVPVNEQGLLTLNYYGKQGIFRTISAVDIVKKRLKSVDELKNTIVFVGATELGINDMRATPVDSTLPGIEIHATAASNILQNRFLIHNANVILIEIACIILFPFILTIILGLIRNTFIGLSLTFCFIGIYFGINYILFAYYYLNTGVVFPIISIGLSYLGSEAYRNLIEERHGRFLKKAFANYLSPALVNEIIKNPKMLKLGGDKREMSILFSDIRGFTSISEKLSPESLVSLLNRYLGPMTNIVLKNYGTLDKYIGDAVMAIFGAPIKLEDHSLSACISAIEMIKALPALNEIFKSEGLPEIAIGIGINTGEAIAGNMGTDVRFDYTVIGDTVNLASRLESLTKMYKCHIIVSGATRTHVEGFCVKLPQNGLKIESTGLEFNFRELDLIKVKGKNEPVTMYELSLTLDMSSISKFEEGLRLYRSQRFTEAKGIFQSLYENNDDHTCSVYIKRCEEFLLTPPSKDWDGVYVATSK